MLKLITLIGDALDSLLDWVGYTNFLIGFCIIMMTIGILAPILPEVYK